MKNDNLILLYDDACPLCVAYTNGFVKTGLLQATNRVPFSKADKALLAKIDLSRGINEIPLINTATNNTLYGIDALLKILSQKLKLVKPIGNIRPIRWVLQKAYKFISYNRKVVVATSPAACGFNCTPDFNLKYRLAFILFFLVINTLLLFPLHKNILQYSLFSHTSLVQLQIAHGLLVSTNIALSFSLPFQKRVDYLGQVTMLALTVVLLCIPLLCLNYFVNAAPSQFNDFYLGMLTCFIAREYIRRIKYLEIAHTYNLIVSANVIAIIVFVLYLIL
jgi:predicted DCC family thiol-disulfide oxidoreductase YuxK